MLPHSMPVQGGELISITRLVTFTGERFLRSAALSVDTATAGITSEGLQYTTEEAEGAAILLSIMNRAAPERLTLAQLQALLRQAQLWMVDPAKLGLATLLRPMADDASPGEVCHL